MRLDIALGPALLAVALMPACRQQTRPAGPARAPTPRAEGGVAAASGTWANTRSLAIFQVGEWAGRRLTSGCADEPTSPLDFAYSDRLIFDGGGSLQPGPGRMSAEDAMARARAIIDEYNALGLDALVLSMEDLRLGREALLELKKHARFPILAANVFEHDSPEPPFDQGLVFDVAGIKVGVFGLVRPVWAEADSSALPFHLVGPHQAARQQVAALGQAGAEVFVALASVRTDELRLIHEAVPELTLIVTTRLEDPADPEFRGATAVVNTGGGADSLLALLLEVPPGVRPSDPYVDANEAERLRARLAQLEPLIENERHPTGRPPRQDQLDALLKKRAELEARRTKLVPPRLEGRVRLSARRISLSTYGGKQVPLAEAIRAVIGEPRRSP